MRYFVVFLVLTSSFLGCGRKKDRPERSQGQPAGLEGLAPFVPNSWDLKTDWQGSALVWKELSR